MNIGYITLDWSLNSFIILRQIRKKSKLWSTVKGIKIKVSGRTIQKTLQLPEGDIDEWSLDYDPCEAYSLMIELPASSNSRILMLTSFNTNSFPPLQRILHHHDTSQIDLDILHQTIK